MLLDKSGLRRKGTIPPDPNVEPINLEMPDDEFNDMLGMFGFQTMKETEQEKSRTNTNRTKQIKRWQKIKT